MISDILKQKISRFQNGKIKRKGVVDNLFVVRGIVNHAKYLGKDCGSLLMTLKNALIVYCLKIV